MEDKTLIEYIIQDTNDKGANKSILYGAKDIYKLKERLSMYEDMKTGKHQRQTKE